MLKPFKPTIKNIAELLEQPFCFEDFKNETIDFLKSDLHDSDLKYIFKHFHLRKMFLIGFFKKIGFDFSLDYDTQRDEKKVQVKQVGFRRTRESSPSFHANHLTFMSSTMNNINLEIVHIKDQPLLFVDIKINILDSNNQKVGGKILSFDLSHPNEALNNISVEIQRIYKTYHAYDCVLKHISKLELFV
jgi:hypothetical protein